MIGPLPVTENTIQSVRTLVTSVFPVSYNRQFFNDCLNPKLCSIMVDKNRAVAIIMHKQEKDDVFGEVMYLRIIGVHPLYRCCGVGSQLLSICEDQARLNGLKAIILHVQTSNTNAIEFYEKRGFVKDKLVTRYYIRCDPPDAYRMIKIL